MRQEAQGEASVHFAEPHGADTGGATPARDRVIAAAEILDLTHDAVFVRSMMNVVQYWNRAAEQLYGWTLEEVVGRVSHAVLKTEFPVPLEHIEAELIRAGRWEGELTHTHKNGTQVMVASRWSLQRDERSELIAIIETNNDISERKRTEEALRRSEEQWRTTFESNPTMYFMVDETGVILQVNAFGAGQLGYNVSELVGQPVLNVFYESDRKQVQQHAESCFQNLGHTMLWEARKIRKDGSMLWVRETANAVLLEKRPVLLVVCENISERKYAEADRARLEERLLQAEKMEAVGRFASGIAHDFSNILGGILAYGEMLFDEAPDNVPRKRYAQNVLTAATRGRDLVDQILAYTRSQRGKRAPTEVCRTVAETLDLVRSSLSPRISLYPTIPDAPLVVMGDATQLHQVVMNLCSNAIYAMRAGGPLRVGVTPTELAAEHTVSHGTLRPGSYVCISVEDSGCGIDGATLGRIFEPFFTTKEFGRGTGLGLALVYAIVIDLEGAIDVKSVPDEGSTFSIYLPLAEVTATVAA